MPDLRPCADCGRPTRHGLQCVACDAAAQPPQRTEASEQMQLVSWLRARGHHPIYVPNGTQGSARRNHIARNLGQADGAPDLIIPCIDGLVVAVELKQLTAGRQRKAQEAMQAYLEACGWRYILAHGSEAAIVMLEDVGL